MTPIHRWCAFSSYFMARFVIIFFKSWEVSVWLIRLIPSACLACSRQCAHWKENYLWGQYSWYLFRFERKNRGQIPFFLHSCYRKDTFTPTFCHESDDHYSDHFSFNAKHYLLCTLWFVRLSTVLKTVLQFGAVCFRSTAFFYTCR